MRFDVSSSVLGQREDGDAISGITQVIGGRGAIKGHIPRIAHIAEGLFNRHDLIVERGRNPGNHGTRGAIVRQDGTALIQVDLDTRIDTAADQDAPIIHINPGR